ncbi:hypothetical protein BXZ70DRAFT_585377 [Cristinia sonorae]|uniref:HMG box domain-containing protein n=1 Tax=Cristinia sonorae TaxID=1940300 RepID=A0A8K0XKH5_9AGAR|nr:hypothetical protein BXZ70DRAFT_585377 [Cristinia sonorae]
MPATTRLSAFRRRSSIINGLIPVKAGNYGIVTSPRPSPKAVVFAPNVTPGTFTEPEPSIDEDTQLPPSPSDALFPPSLNPDNTQSRRRVPPGKRRSQGYIPRPPNAFMLFRADFVRQKHVPGSIETNHGSLSKIIGESPSFCLSTCFDSKDVTGNCWRALPLEEKKTWENLAKQAKAKHQKLYPDYRFRPVHNKAKKLAREAAKAKTMGIQDEQRCEDVAAMLLEGKKGDELAAAVRDYDQSRAMTESPLMHAPIPTHAQAFDPLFSHHPPSYQFARRPSSVPLPGISLPSLPFYLPNQHMMQQSASRPESPISHYARSRLLGSRRPSSAAPIMNRSWEMTTDYFPTQLQPDHEPLPEVSDGIFNNPSFLGPNGFTWGAAPEQVHDQSSLGFGGAVQQPDLALSISPLDVATNDGLASASTAMSSAYPFLTPNGTDTYPFNMNEFLPPLEHQGSSGPSSAFSGSPAPSDTSLPVNLHAPKPHHPVAYESWEQQQQQQQAMNGMHGDFTGMVDGTVAHHLEFDPSYAMGGSATYHCGPDGTVDPYHSYHDDMTIDGVAY